MNSGGWRSTITITKRRRWPKNLDMRLSDARVWLLNRSQCCTKRRNALHLLTYTPTEYEHGVKWELWILYIYTWLSTLNLCKILHFYNIYMIKTCIFFDLCLFVRRPLINDPHVNCKIWRLYIAPRLDVQRLLFLSHFLSADWLVFLDRRHDAHLPLYRQDSTAVKKLVRYLPHLCCLATTGRLVRIFFLNTRSKQSYCSVGA
jgi:hypothetical protein